MHDRALPLELLIMIIFNVFLDSRKDRSSQQITQQVTGHLEKEKAPL